MLWTIVAVLFVLWLLALFTGTVGSGGYLILVIVIVIVAIRLLQRHES